MLLLALAGRELHQFHGDGTQVEGPFGVPHAQSRAILLNSVAPHFEPIEYHTKTIAAYLKSIDVTLAVMLPDGKEKIEPEFVQYREVARAASLELEGYTAELDVLREQIRSHNRAQFARIYLLDWAVPLLVGGYAIASTANELVVLLKALIGH